MANQDALHFRPLRRSDINRYGAYVRAHGEHSRWYRLKHLYIMRRRYKTQIAVTPGAIYLKSQIDGNTVLHKPIVARSSNLESSYIQASDFATSHDLRPVFIF
jgi:hypothetical protein